jgi:hypothetical protein
MSIQDGVSGPIYIGVGYGLIAPASEPQPVKNDREYVSGSRGIIRAKSKQALSQSIDSLTRQFGWQVYDAMLCDPIVSGAFDILRLGILGSEMQMSPTHKKATPDAEDTPETIRSKEIADFDTRLIASFDRDWTAFLWEALEALAYGNKLAEKVYRLEDCGEDKGRLVFETIKFKPRWTWLFVTDGRFNVLGIMAWTADETGVTVLPRDKFAIFTCQSRDGDPRGTSVLRAAYESWNEKVLLWPDYQKFRTRFGNPKPIGTTAEGERARPPLDANGKSIAGTIPVSPQEYLVELLAEWSNDAVIAVPHGTEIDLCEPKGDGKLYREAVDLFNREIVHAILKNARTTLEAEHGSKADSESAQDVTGMAIRLYRRFLSDFVRREIIMPANELNFGKEDARKYTPHPTFADIEHQDFEATAGAFAKLKTAGLIPDELIPTVLEKLGLPIPETLTFSGGGDDLSDAEETDNAEADNIKTKVDPKAVRTKEPNGGRKRTVKKA